MKRNRALTLLPLLAACAGASSQPTQWVKSVEITGTNKLDSDDLGEGLETRKTPWWPWSDRRPFDADAVDQDRERIQRAAAERGYFASNVEAKVADQPDGAHEVQFIVKEGPESTIAQVDVEGMPAGIDVAKILTRRHIVVGEPYRQIRYEATKNNLAEALHAAGYPDAVVVGRVRVDRKQPLVAIDYVAATGPLVHLGKFDVKGEEPLPKDKLLDLVEWEPGDKFTPDVFGDTESRFYGTSVIAAVKLDFNRGEAASQPASMPSSLPAEMASSFPGSMPSGIPASQATALVVTTARVPTLDAASPTEETRDVVATVTPSALHELRLGGGLGFQRRRQEVRLRAEWAHLNFLGGLRQLRISLRPAFAVIPAIWEARQFGPAGEFEVSLSQPNFLGTHLLPFVVAGYDLGIQEGFQFHGPRFQVGVERPFFRQRLRIGTSWNFQFLNFFNLDTTVFDPLKTPLGLGFRNPYRLAYLEAFALLDLRDNPLDTMWGIYAEGRAEWGTEVIGGQFNYVKLKPEVRGYVSAGRRITFAGRAQLGWMAPYGTTRALESPLTRRFALGGPTSHRGFSIGRLAPQVPSAECAAGKADCRTIPIGGHGLMLFSLDVRIRLVKIFDYWLGIVPFVDMGDVTTEFAQLDLTKMHIATGLSLVYLAPFGEVRFGSGVRLNRLRLTESDGSTNPDGCANPSSFTGCTERFAFHLSIGGAF